MFEEDDARERLNAELAAVERQWHADQERHMVRDADGNLVPRKPVSVKHCIILMVGSVLAMAIFSATPLPSLFVYIGLIPFGLGTFRLMIGATKAEAFERCKTEYDSRRASVYRRLQALDAAERGF